jgi:hypothetical protein
MKNQEKTRANTERGFSHEETKNKKGQYQFVRSAGG